MFNYLQNLHKRQNKSASTQLKSDFQLWEEITDTSAENISGGWEFRLEDFPAVDLIVISKSA
ncbi:MAG: hypothetical protein HRU34_04870 [Richelia sp.]|nr:hypothetical protein [Richelia sp.]